MRRSRFALVAVLVSVLAGAQGSAAAAPAPGEDSVTGTSQNGGLFDDIVLDAHSDHDGANPRGTAGFNLVDAIPLYGPVTCLSVRGNRAVIVYDSPLFSPMRLEIVDNEGTGQPDLFTAVPDTPDCSLDTGFVGMIDIVRGDLVVHDAIDPDDCRRGGWRDLVDGNGEPFRNQGQCVAAANRG